jgi:CRISPR/Cas system-associated exonuclease Cas4 (RecB family)
LGYNNQKDHISVTQMRMFLRCPLQYYYRYIRGMKIPPNGDLTLGKTIHSTLENNYRQKINSREDLPLDAWTDYFSDEWEKGEKMTEFKSDEKPGDFKDDGYKIIKTYHGYVSRLIQPVDVERGFLIALDGIRRPLLGYIDLIDENGCIVDHKVTKRSWQEAKIHTDPQMTAYALAYRRLTGKKENGLRFDVMVRTKNPKIQRLNTERKTEDFGKFQKLLSHVEKAIETGIFYPNENFMCPACGYKEMCDRW